MEKVKQLIIHCSDSDFGSANLIRKWHQEKGWRDIGYHFVVLNGWIVPDFYLPSMDGSIECGRDLDGDSFIEPNEIGAHALGYNQTSIGICLIGTKDFSCDQFSNAEFLCADLRARFNVPIEEVKGHYECENSHGKTCPNFDMDKFRQDILKKRG